MAPSTLSLVCLSLAFPWQDGADPDALAVQEDDEPSLEQLEAMFLWRTGEVTLKGGLATLHLPEGARYLDPRQTHTVLEDFWGNPPREDTLGMIFPEGASPFLPETWAVVLDHEADGHVDDDDAGEIDHDELLEDMQDEARAASAEREKAGYGSIEIVGWAAAPHYEAGTHRLHWAKELRFDGAGDTTLNYDVRVLGREGVLSMNAVADMAAIQDVEAGMQALLGAVEFGDGHRYDDYEEGVDKLAAYGIGGLIAGKLALKAGLFKGLLALLIAGKKAVIALVAVVVAFVGKLFGKKKDAQPAE